MTIIQQQFFELLKSGLWGGAPDASLFVGEVDWSQLFQLARRQALPAIVLDGVRLLPEELRPPKALYLQWCAVMLHVEEQNELLNREIGNLYALLRAQGMEPVLAKGQGVAQCYRLPHHRQCGDIDLYLGRRFYEQANALLRPEATDEHEETFKHSCMHWHGVIVENHCILISLNRPSADRRMQRAIASWWNNGAPRCPKMKVGDTLVSVPPYSFNVAYVLTHATLSGKVNADVLLIESDERYAAVPVIMLTARGTESDKVAGLDAGADDYVVKPFSPRELIARMRAVLRRGGTEAEKTVTCGPLTINEARFSAKVEGEPIKLGVIEFKMLLVLASSPGRVYSRAQLLSRVWDDSTELDERTVDVHILRLRKQLAGTAAASLVETVRGLGYRANDAV